ncbi:hypothetical protein PIB30_100994, partial [Stylosanthes scabra]|nr:hypothetical protein [Stylosanthes scabra]
MEDPVLLSLFDEIRPYRNYVWCKSRRIWLELYGLPVHAWSKINFKKIVKLWGKLEMQDDVTESTSSLSVTRILIDSFQSELINEWIIVKVDDVKFEVYVKEFGG